MGLYTPTEWTLMSIRQTFYSAGRHDGKFNERIPEDLIVAMAARIAQDKPRLLEKATATAKEAYEDGWKEGSKEHENLNLLSAQ